MSKADEKIPDKVTEEEIWLSKNIITGIRVDYKQTGTDTAETFIYLQDWIGKERCWSEGTFRKYVDLRLGYNSIAEPKPGIKERVKARLDWEKANDYELNLYKKLKEKYG